MIIQQNLKYDPVQFSRLSDLIRGLSKKPELLTITNKVYSDLDTKYNKINTIFTTICKSNDLLFSEIQQSTRNQNPFRPLDEQMMDAKRFYHTVSGTNFLSLAEYCFKLQLDAFVVLKRIATNLVPPMIYPGIGIISDISKLDLEKINILAVEQQVNGPLISTFLSGISELISAKLNIIELVHSVSDRLESYYKTLDKRHTVDGIKIHKDPIITDISISIFENIDAHGEIDAGKKADEISVYSTRKAEAFLMALSKREVSELIDGHDKFIIALIDNFKNMWEITTKLEDAYESVILEISNVDRTFKKGNLFNFFDDEFEANLSLLGNLSFGSIVEKEINKLLSREEKFELDFKNETIKQIANFIVDKKQPSEIFKAILKRKEELHTHYKDENSFYVCRIGSGNVFLGDAPGSLMVVPGSRPNITLDEIIGSGFDEVRDFVSQIESAAKWQDLFIATSPSKSADKTNVLLIGPPGCGKTEMMRAVASDKNSIGIFAQGSDFNTCWKGEAEKNPKRLFEAAVKLQKEANKHVHILIDEIDSILVKQELLGHGETNLTLEFQMLMDGMVHYPQITVWGTTNNPERIPMAMIRRFSFVSIVGELDNNHRVTLLKQFTDYFPQEKFSDNDWNELAKKLDGATGDVIRKIVDYIWRSKMNVFVKKNPEAAESLLKFLNDDERFDIGFFDDTKRKIFKSRLKENDVYLCPEDISKSINVHLSNIAVYSEIEEAKKVYKKAKEFFNSIRMAAI